MFSCRSDMQIISHYYFYEKHINRYENGILNRVYYINNPNNIFYIENGVTHTYQSVFMPKHISNDQLKNDLDLFLKEFNDKKLYNCFNRHEPKCL